MEIGCGCGSSILPVLLANPHAKATVTVTLRAVLCTHLYAYLSIQDVSATSISQLFSAAAKMGVAQSIQRRRHESDSQMSHHSEEVPQQETAKAMDDICTQQAGISSFVCDATDPSQAHLFEGIGADFLLIMFTLSAVTPERQLQMLLNAHRALSAEGSLLIRDHGLFDMVQLRIPPEQCLGPNLYRRGDGTLSYFFSLDDLRSRAEAAGFGVEELRYVCVINKNRKTGVELRRVFVHGVFTKRETERNSS